LTGGKDLNRKVFLLALITIIIWGSTFAAIRAGLQGGYSAGHLVLIRFLVASGAFLIYALWPGVRFQLPRKDDIFKILMLGWIGISIYQISLTFGEQTIEAGAASMIISSAPIFASLIAILVLNERLNIYGWIGLSIGFIGIILITLGTTGASFHMSTGVFWMLLATITTSIFFVFQKPFYNRYKPIELMAYFTWAGTLPLFIFIPGLFQDIQNATLEAHLSAIYVGIFPAAVAYVTWATALSLGKTSSVTSMMYIVPVIAIIIAWIWLREWPSTLSFIGGIIAISSVVVVNWMGNRDRLVTVNES